MRTFTYFLIALTTLLAANPLFTLASPSTNVLTPNSTSRLAKRQNGQQIYNAILSALQSPPVKTAILQSVTSDLQTRNLQPRNTLQDDLDEFLALIPESDIEGLFLEYLDTAAGDLKPKRQVNPANYSQIISLLDEISFDVSEIEVFVRDLFGGPK